jgi:hypothetical protein
MNTIIAVKGVANRGKSASIKKVCELLKIAYPRADIQQIFIGIDITIIITIEGRKVGIESQGDPNSRLFDSLDRFVKVGCTVIICATRTYGRTVEAVNAQSGQYSIKWLDKQNEPAVHLQNAANDAVATKILHAVQSALAA